MSDGLPHWGICYHTNSASPRARKWYYLARVIKVDGQWFELYWHAEHRSNSRAATRESALNAGLDLLHGTFKPAPLPRQGSTLVWSLDEEAKAA